MLSFFRTNQLLVGVFILAYALLLHLSCFWEPPTPIGDAPGIANTWLQAYLNDHLSWHLPITLLFLFLQALLVNSLIFNHRIISPVNLFPGVFVVLVGSLVPEFLPLSVYHFANVFLLLAIRSYLKAFRVNSAADRIFNTGFWLGIAMFFVPTYVFFLLGFSLMLPILKSGKFRDQVILLVGTIFPHYIAGLIYFWQDSLNDYWSLQWKGAFSLPQFVNWDTVPFFSVLVLAIITILVLLSRRQYRLKTKMEVQLKLNIFYWLLLASGVSALFTMPWKTQHWLAAAPFLGIFLSMNFTKAKPTTAEAWHLILLLVVFLLQFGSKLGIPFL